MSYPKQIKIPEELPSTIQSGTTPSLVFKSAALPQISAPQPGIQLQPVPPRQPIIQPQPIVQLQPAPQPQFQPMPPTQPTLRLQSTIPTQPIKSPSLFSSFLTPTVTFTPEEIEPEIQRAMLPPAPQSIRIERPVSTHNFFLSPEQRLRNQPDTFTELQVMPVRCTGCGKVFKQVAIEESIKSGKTLNQVAKDLGYSKGCCRNDIFYSEPIIKLQKQIQEHKNLDKVVSNMTLESTGSQQPTLLSSYSEEGRLKVIDEVPPGLVNQMEGICFTGMLDVNLDADLGDAYEHIMRNYID